LEGPGRRSRQSDTSASLTFAAVERETCLVEIEDVLELLGLDLNLARLLISVSKPELEKCL
jgi:hypothetical protein